MHSSRRSSRGFTLIEMIMALVILGIISVGVGSFLQFGVNGYVSTVDRERLQSEARFVMERISREIRHAAPNSVSENGNCLSFYPAYLSAFYFEQPSSTASQIELVPRQDEVGLWTATGDDGSPLIANTGIAVGFASSEQYGATLKPAATSMTVSGGVGTLNYANSIESQSPAKRLYLYGEQVSFCFDGNRQLTRQVKGKGEVVLSDKLANFGVNVTGAGLNSNGVVHMALSFEDPRSGETSNYNNSVQVINAL